MINYNKLKNKAIKLKSDISASKRKLKSTEQELEELIDKRDKLKNNISVQEKSIEVMKDIIDKMSEGHRKKLENVVNQGLKTIFYDENYSIKIKVEEKRNRNTAEFRLLEKRDGYILETELEEASGGGVRVVLGFILQVFYIMHFNLNRILFLDESFSQLSDKYIKGLIEFINQLSEKRGFKFVLISHDPRINPYADRVYRVRKGKVHLEDDGGGDNK